MANDLTLIVNYIDGANFIYNSDKIEFTGTEAQLKLIDNPAQTFNQPYTSDAGFIYDNTKTEFAAGKCQQKDLQPVGSLSWVTYAIDINLNYGGGTLTGTAVGGAAVVANRLDLAHSDIRYVNYNAIGNANSQQVGAIKFKFTPNYNIKPATEAHFFSITNAHNDIKNCIFIRHSPDGALRLHILDSVGGVICEQFLGTWSAVLGTTYEFEINWDITAGANRVFINGIQIGATATATGIRDSNINLLRIGSGYSGILLSNFYIKDFIYFSTVQHTANYIPGYTLPEMRYVGDVISLPQFSYSGLGALQAWTNFVTTDINNPRYTMNSKWWNGAAWVISTNVWTEANTPAEILAHIAVLPALDTLDVKLITNDNNAMQMSTDDLTVIYIGQIYPTDNPTVKSNTTTEVDGLGSFAATIIAVGSDAVKFTLEVDGTQKYWDGAAWSTSSGYAQSNTAADINTNIGAYDLSAKHYMRFVSYLHSDVGTTTPNISQHIFTFDFAVSPTVPNTCRIYGWMRDVKGNPIPNAIVRFYTSPPFFHGPNYITLDESKTIDLDGYFEIAIIETATINKNISLSLTYVGDNGNTITKVWNGIVIPEQIAASWDSLIL